MKRGARVRTENEVSLACFNCVGRFVMQQQFVSSLSKSPHPALRATLSRGDRALAASRRSPAGRRACPERLPAERGGVEGCREAADEGRDSFYAATSDVPPSPIRIDVTPDASACSAASSFGRMPPLTTSLASSARASSASSDSTTSPLPASKPATSVRDRIDEAPRPTAITAAALSTLTLSRGPGAPAVTVDD